MNSNMDITGFKDVNIDKLERLQERMVLHVSMPKREGDWSGRPKTSAGTARTE